MHIGRIFFYLITYIYLLLPACVVVEIVKNNDDFKIFDERV